MKIDAGQIMDRPSDGEGPPGRDRRTLTSWSVYRSMSSWPGKQIWPEGEMHANVASSAVVRLCRVSARVRTENPSRPPLRRHEEQAADARHLRPSGGDQSSRRDLDSWGGLA